MSMTIDELVSHAAQLPPVAQAQLVQRLLALRGETESHAILPPGTPGAVWVDNWEQVSMEPAVASAMLEAIADACD